MFEQLKKQVPVNSKKFFWPLIRKILIWTFWDYKSSWSKKSTPIQPQGVIGAPLLCIYKRCNSWECSVHFFRGPWFKQLSFAIVISIFIKRYLISYSKIYLDIFPFKHPSLMVSESCWEPVESLTYTTEDQEAFIKILPQCSICLQSV